MIRLKSLRLVLILLALALLAAVCKDTRSERPSVQSNGRTASHAARFDPNAEPGALSYARLVEEQGPCLQPNEAYKIGAIVKFLGNPYWQNLVNGMQAKADELGVELDVQAPSTESDAAGQLAIMERMLGQNYAALLISPQTDKNLTPAVEEARKKNILVLNVDDGVLEEPTYWVGPNHYEEGALAARYLKQRMPEGGKVAILKGPVDDYAVDKRTLGFVDALKETPIEVVATMHCNWDLQEALDAAELILQEHPDLQGFYCNSDVMALGAAEAVKSRGKAGRIFIIGTDGIGPAHEAIRAGEMTATVDSFPFRTGEAAVEVAVRLLEGQKVPRAVFTLGELVAMDSLGSPLPQ